jgi:N-acetylneuraminate synthase
MKPSIRIGGRAVGPGQPVYIVAELSANHGRSYEQACQVVRAAKAAGADALKVQTYTPDTLTIQSDAPPFRIQGGTPWDGRTLYELYAEACMPWEWQAPLQALAAELGLAFFSTPFDASAVEVLERLNVPAYKVASFELVDLPLLRAIGRTRKPVILSTGMADLGEIQEAVEALQSAGAAGVALLKCTSAYPAPPEEMNLRTIPDLAGRFQLPVGLSDHTLGIAAPVAAVALGACLIEKHLTLSRRQPGPDAAFSLEPHEFKAMAEAIRTTEAALGRVTYEPSALERTSRQFRRSLFVVRDVQAGEVFSEANVRSIRPSAGLAPKHLPAILGRQAACNLKRGTPLAWPHIRP